MGTRSECGAVRLVSAGAFFVAMLTGHAAGQVTSRVSVDTSGAQGNDDSYIPSVSADGRYVAFHSNAANLVGGDTNGIWDVFVHDRLSGTTERVSVDSSGAQGNSGSFDSSISADGRYVAFWSVASNLVAGDTNGYHDVFIHDRLSGTTERVSVDSSGAEGDAGSSHPSISDDGRYVAFFSNASNLAAGDTNGADDVFVHDRQSGMTERVSVDSNGAQGNTNSDVPSISADGRCVAFESFASNLVAGDTNGCPDIFVHDRQNGTTERVSIDSNGAQGNNDSNWVPSISADGRYVAFQSYATNLVVGDTNNTYDVFVRDRQSGTTERVSIDSSGVQGHGDSFIPSISADGRYVAFTSGAPNLVAGDTNGWADIFIHDRLIGANELVSVDSSGRQGNDHSYGPSISGDGRYVAFWSWASNLVGGDTNGVLDVFLRDRERIGTKYCTSTVNSTGSPADLSASGSASSGTGDLMLTSAPVPNQNGIFFHGNHPNQVPFGNGFLCMTGGITRGPVVMGLANVATYTYDNSDAKHSLTAFIGSTRYFQHWFRDPAAGGAFFNTSNAVSIAIEL